jgi:hypothetical protein
MANKKASLIKVKTKGAAEFFPSSSSFSRRVFSPRNNFSLRQELALFQATNTHGRLPPKYFLP